jgi:hypothetical protein
MHLLPSVAIQPNLELKTRPKQLLGSLPLVIPLPALADLECGHALCLQGCTHPLHRSEREREKKKEGDREKEGERKRESINS